MMAIINLSNQDEIVYDLNVQIFNCIEPKSQAKARWAELEEMISDGLDEATAYSYVYGWIKENNSCQS
ncbi:MAG: hypothetical protein DRQ78_09080 [Epsilonproteobacteria bacterium]|nr:MAG: hypothetical protein DRQ78_09080 [Campylobacterota bacterium]